MKQVTNIDQPTTSTDTILAANALNYHTWRTENDKLLQRMGELRHNGEEARGPGSGCGEQKSAVTENLILKTSLNRNHERKENRSAQVHDKLNDRINYLHFILQGFSY